MTRLPQPYENEDDYAEYRENAAEEERARKERELITVRGQWAPADFLYDPLSKRGFE